jgi:phosphonate transport system substrate-binding protein
MKLLRLTSCQAGNVDFVGRAIAAYLAEQLSLPTEFVGDLPWQKRAALFEAGQIEIAWICGLPYVWKVDRPQPTIELLAAPVMKSHRYQAQPVYYSDVVVHRDSPFHTFADLRGASWAYNEPGSQSGYNATRYHLATLQEKTGYFGQALEAGAHQTSLQMILQRTVDASAIDSTVLEMELKNYPEIAPQIRIIATFGHSPIPPWVILKRVPLAWRETVREALLTMHHTAEGQAILAEAMMARFVQVTDKDYDSIREMARQAELITL